MDFMELCERRQSCRSFSDTPVEHEKLVRCIKAARLAPSGCNAQPWSFVVVESPALLPEVAKALQPMGFNAWADNAKSFIVVLEEHALLVPKLRAVLDSQYFAKGDLGGAALSICLEAESQGLGTCIIGLFDREKLCELLHLPKEQRFFCVIAVGYPANPKYAKNFANRLKRLCGFYKPKPAAPGSDCWDSLLGRLSLPSFSIREVVLLAFPGYFNGSLPLSFCCNPCTLEGKSRRSVRFAQAALPLRCVMPCARRRA